MIHIKELPIPPLAMQHIRARLDKHPMKPFVLVCGLKNLIKALDGSGIRVAEVEKHSHELTDGLWYYNVARAYSPDGKPLTEKIERKPKLVQIGKRIGNGTA